MLIGLMTLCVVSLAKEISIKKREAKRSFKYCTQMFLDRQREPSCLFF